MVKEVESVHDVVGIGSAQEGADPITVTIDVSGGTITWQPGPHMQEHLQEAVEGDELDDAVASLQQMFAIATEGIQSMICSQVFLEQVTFDDTDVLRLAIEAIFGAKADDVLVMLFGTADEDDDKDDDELV